MKHYLFKQVLIAVGYKKIHNTMSDIRRLKSSQHVEPVRLLAIAGSLRSNSVNRALLEAAEELVPPGVTVALFDISEIPLYNQDLDTDERRPESVGRLKSAIADADGLLIATPEYNYSFPGVLKNVIDWASRPAMRSPLKSKPVAIVGASPSAMGTSRAQEQLKLVLLSTMSDLFPHPGFLLSAAHKKFSDGKLIDEAASTFLADYLTKLSSWIRERRIVRSQAA